MSGNSSSSTAPPSQDGKRRFIEAPRVFVPAAVLLVVFVALGAIMPARLGKLINAANSTVVNSIGWWYIFIVTGFVVFCIWLAFSPMGRIRLGKDGEDPEFGIKSWFAMLFAAGMGIGLVFWGVAEPLNHFAASPPGFGGDAADKARTAMDFTFLHWGLHAWSIYVIVGLGVAYAVHRKGRPVSIRWALEPLLGKRVTGFWGDVIDVIAIVGTLFGVATSLGFGVTQVGAGLSFLGLVGEPSNTLLVILIAIITGFALVSVVTGVDKGIKWLSNINMVVAGLLALLVLVLGPTIFLLSDFVQQLGSYLQNLVRLSFNTFSFQGNAGQSWMSSWTTYYWGWWISWAPFVGVFIARISRGRTVREFIAGVLLVPSIVTFVWFSIMGGSALYREIFGNGGLISQDGSVPTNTALFELLDGLPGGPVLSGIAIVLIVIFFVTSSDSGSFVVDMIATGGDPNPPVWSRAFWGTLEGVIAAVLLVAGGLAALQTMAILVAVPFSIVMVLMVASITRALTQENREINRRRERAFAERVADHVNGDESAFSTNGETAHDGSRTGVR
jgi:choline/glycine/proline betaine transport protein